MSRRLSRRNTRVLALMFAVICLSIGCLASPASADTADFSIVIDGVEVDSDESPRIENDRIVVPIRVVSESLGREVEWLAHTRQILVLGDGAQSDEFVLLTIGENLALLNGEEVELDVAPFIVPASGRALVPLRFVAEAFGSEVDWDAEDRTAIIASGRPEEEPEGAGGPGEGPDEVLGYEMTSHGLELDVSGTFEWMTVRDSPDIVILRLTGTQLGEEVPPMQAFDEGPIARVSLSSGEGTDESVYLSVSLREELTRRIEANDSGLSMELAYLESVEIVTDDGGPRVMLRTTIPVDVRTFTLKEPARAVVDLFGTEWADATTSEEFEDDILRSVRFGRHRESVGDLFSGTRMVLDLWEYRVPVISTRERDDHFEIAVGVRTSSIAGKVVALDPGHGGLDPGAQGVQVP
ncbi:MAG: stalk domain-containing protein, partial [Bacillota bacterium]